MTTISPIQRLIEERRRALDLLVADCSGEGGAILLIEKEGDNLLALPAYVNGTFLKRAEDLAQSALIIPLEIWERSENHEIERSIIDSFAEAGFLSSSPERVSCDLFASTSLDTEKELSTRELMAACIIDGVEPEDISNAESHISNFNTFLSSTRNERFKEAVHCLHGFVPMAPDGTLETRKKVEAFVKREVGAKLVERRVRRKADASRRIGQRLLVKQSPTAEFPGDAKKAAIRLSKVRPLPLRIEAREDCYHLESHKFCTPTQLKADMKALNDISATMIFSDRSVDGDLQKIFGSTDFQIAQSAFDLFEAIFENEKRNHLAARLLEIEANEEMQEASLGEYLGMIFTGIPEVSGVFLVDIDIFGATVELSSSCVSGNDKLDEDYLRRLRIYSEDFYQNPAPSAHDILLSGIDCLGDDTVHEFHLPSRDGSAHFVLVRYTTDIVPTYLVNSITRIVEQAFIRSRRQDLIAARSNYLVETRHAVVHYFSIVREGMRNLKYMWAKGLRSPTYWEKLPDVKEFRESIDTINWAVNHANLILENGRFLINEIDAQGIKKRPIVPDETIQECLKVLQSLKQKRRLVTHQVIRGAKPPIVNGDRVLMEICFLNLFDNAMKYAPVGSTVRWELDYSRDYYEFRVSNSGDPIDQKRLQLLMQVGYRGRQQDRLNIRPGTGLGLPVAQKILLAHSPEAGLSLRSERSAGEDNLALNTFSFRMPYLTGIEHQAEKAAG